MELPPLILADSDDLPKIIFGIIFFVIWAISALVSWINKMQQEAKRRAREQLERAQREAPQRQASQRQASQRRPVPIAEGLAQRHPEVLLPPQRRPVPPQWQPLPPQRRPVPPPSGPRPAMKRSRPQRVVPPPLPPETIVHREAPAPPVPAVTEEPARRAPTVNARALAPWLNPSTLRQQYILTEILQPPLALRSQDPTH